VVKEEMEAMVLNNITIRARNLYIGYDEGENILWALNGIDIDIPKNTAYCIVGESGSGKTTFGNAVVGLLPPYVVTKGYLEIYNNRVIDNDRLNYSGIRGDIAVRIPQNPIASLNPYLKIESIFLDILKHRFKSISREKAFEIALEAIRSVGLSDDVLNKYPHQLSGGMSQRVAIALTIAINPEIIVADEPTSNLDAYLKGTVLNLLKSIISKGKTLIVITHDILFASALCNFIAVMFMGSILEIGRAVDILTNPLHSYTKELIDAANLSYINFKHFDNELRNSSKGCVYASRCPYYFDKCIEKPKMYYINQYHGVACWRIQKSL